MLGLSRLRASWLFEYPLPKNESASALWDRSLVQDFVRISTCRIGLGSLPRLYQAERVPGLVDCEAGAGVIAKQASSKVLDD